MRKLLLAVSAGVFTTAAMAQFAAGGQVNYSKYFSSGPSFIGLGINGTLVVADDYPIRLSVNFGLPNSEEYTTTVNALSNQTTPSYLTVKYTEKISLLNFWLDAQKYFGDGDFGDGGLYGLLGVGFTSAKVDYEVGSYNLALYDTAIQEENQSIGQLGIRGGLGYDVGLDFGNIFIEAGLNLSANQANGQTVEVNLPSFLFGNIGVRHWFE